MTLRRSQQTDLFIESFEPMILMSASTIEGTDFGEWISGTVADDVISAGAGNDEIHAPLGNNTIDGGDGTDTLIVYEGKSTDFIVQRLADGSIQVQGDGLNDINTTNILSNVEQILFTDKMVNTSDIQPVELPENDNGLADDDEASGSNKSGSNKSGSNKSGSNKSGSNKSGSNKSGSNKSGSNKSGSNKSGSNKSGSNKSGSNKSGSNKSGSDKSSSGKSSSGKSSSDKSSSDKSSSGKSSSGKSGSDKSVSAVSNAAPLAAVDMFTNTAGESTHGNVLANDTDPDGDLLTATLKSAPAHGSVVLNADGDFDYVSHESFSGQDSFEYSVSDGNGGSTTGLVAIDVTTAAGQGNSGPGNDAPVAVNDSFETSNSETLFGNVSLNDSDSDGYDYQLRYKLADEAQHGDLNLYADGSFDYTPDAGFEGTDKFQYTVIDSNGGEAVAIVTITVGTDGPEDTKPFEPDPSDGKGDTVWTPAPTPVDASPAATADFLATKPSSVLTGNLLQNDSDVDGETLTVVDHTAAQHGTVVVNADGTMAYTSEKAYSGIDYFHYTISDGDQTDRATVVIHVNSTGTLDPTTFEFMTAQMIVSPIALDLNGDGVIGVTGETTAQDKSGISEIGDTVEFDIDGDGDLDRIEWFDGSGDGILVDTSKFSGTQIDGSALFGDEGGMFANGYEKLDLLDVDGNNLLEGGELSNLKLWIDDGNAELELSELRNVQSFQIFSIRTTMTLNGGLMQSWAFTLDDSQILTEDVWFAQEVDDPSSDDPGEDEPDDPSSDDDNVAPDANPDVVGTAVQTPVTGNVLSNDRDHDGDSLTVVSHTNSLNGTVSVGDNGHFTYTPDSGFSGIDYFQYLISDGRGGTDTAVVMVTVEDPTSTGGGPLGHAISGTVWRDWMPSDETNSNNGLLDESEVVRGTSVFVSLLNREGAIVQSVHTDANGAYSFSNLADGTYSVRISAASLPELDSQQAYFTLKDVNSNFFDAVDSDVTQADGKSAAIVLGSGTELWETVTVDAGYYYA